MVLVGSDVLCMLIGGCVLVSVGVGVLMGVAWVMMWIDSLNKAFLFFGEFVIRGLREQLYFETDEDKVDSFLGQR